MKKIIEGLASVLAFAFMIGCSGLSDLENRVDVLEGKVKALETVLDVLNGNVSSMQALIDTSIPVTSVSEADGVWTLVFADGSVATLAQGSEGVGVTPVVSIDEEGYWTVNYGNGPEYIYKDAENTQKVKAEGKDASVPVFGVDEAGEHWTVSFDGGKTFEPVQDGTGNPVSVQVGAGSQMSFFEEVSYENDLFTVKLKDSGKLLEIPVVSSFYFRIIGAEGVQAFYYGETRTYRVEQKGVSGTLLTLPDGWTGSLTDETLTITAPVPVKSLTLDSSMEISVLATSAKGYAAVAKMHIELYDTDLWARYEAGKDIVIGGVVINKTTWPDAKLISEPMTDKFTDGLWFLDPDVDQTFAGGYNPTRFIMIGRYADRRSTLKRERYLNLSPTKSENFFVLSNVDIDFTLESGEDQKFMYTLVGNENFENIVFDDVHIDMPSSKYYLLYMHQPESSPKRAMTGNLVVKDCDITVANTADMSLIYSKIPGENGKIASVEITGNTVSSTSGSTGFRMLQTAEPVSSLKMDMNTLVNIVLADDSEANIEN